MLEIEYSSSDHRNDCPASLSCWPHRYLLLMTLLTLCLFSGRSTQAADSDALEEVVIQLKWHHQFQFAGFYAALEQGYYAEEGFNVILRERDLNQDVVSQVLSGEADYGVSDSMLLVHLARGEPVSLLAAIMQHSANAILTLADSGLRSPADLISRRLSFYDTDMEGIDLLAMLAEQGVFQSGLERWDWEDNLSRLLNSELDAIPVYISNEPFTLQEQGIQYHLIHPRNYGLDFYGDILFTSQMEAQNHPERVTAIRRATLRGWQYAMDHKPEAIDMVYEKYNTGNKSREAIVTEARAMEALMDRFITPLGSFDEGRLEYLQNRLESLNLIVPQEASFQDALFPQSRPQQVALSPDEQSFINELGTVRLAVESGGWLPFEQLSADGEFLGIAADYLSLIGNKLGLHFDIQPQLSWQSATQAVRQRDMDMLPAAVPTLNRREYMSFTTPYARSPMVLVTRDTLDYIGHMNQLSNMSIGVVRGYVSEEMLRRYFPDLVLVRYPSTTAGLRGLAGGEIDVFVENLAVANHIINAEGLSNLKVSGQTPFSYDLSFAVRNDWPLLLSAIDKALASITPQEHNEISQRWMQVSLIQPFPWRNALPLLMAGLFIIIALLVYALRTRQLNQQIRLANQQLAQAEQTLREKNRELEELSITDKLTGTFNRHHLDAVLNEEYERARRYQRPMSVIMFDLDRFKQINDQYGHQAGDRALVEFCQVVQAGIRQSDVFGRWGGEEFLLICPDTQARQAQRLGEKIRGAVATHRFQHGDLLTVSAGVADNQGRSSLDALILAADRQLYAAKEAGRNRVLLAEAGSPAEAAQVE